MFYICSQGQVEILLMQLPRVISYLDMTEFLILHQNPVREATEQVSFVVIFHNNTVDLALSKRTRQMSEIVSE